MTALHSYNYLGEQTLCAIEQAMTKVWTSLQTSEPSVDWLKNGELRTLLANRLMDLAEAGITDPDELSRRTQHILKLYRAKKISLSRHDFIGSLLQKESPAVDRAHNQCLSRTSSYQSIESYCPLISQVVLCGMSIEV